MSSSQLTTKTKKSQAPTISPLLEGLNLAQKEAVIHTHGPLLIVAGAGTGKTMVITKRIAHLILDENFKTHEILALTFTDKAAGEMEERVDRILPYGYVQLYISTFHSFAEQVLRAHALDIGLSPDFKLLDSTAQWMLVRKNLDKFPLKYYKPLGNPTKFIHALLQHFSRAKDELISPADYLKYVEDLKLNRDSELIVGGVKVENDLRNDELARLEEVANAYHVYEQLLLEEEALDFGGVLSRLHELLTIRPQILEQYRNQFKHILIDEFQDTNHAQYAIVKLLAAPKNNLTVVADDDQSIYAFRGAAISNVLQFKKDYPDSKEIFLTENYRSCQAILDLSYNFIQQNNPNRLEVRLANTGLSKRLKSNLDEDGLIMHLHTNDLHDEARTVLNTILTLKEKNPELTWDDFAILVRANDHAGTFIRTFDEAGAPYNLIAPRGLYSKPVIMDLSSYLRVLVDTNDSPAVYRVLTSPISKLTDSDLTQLLFWTNKKTQPLFETIKNAVMLDLPKESIEECRRIVNLIEKHTALARRTLVSRVTYAVLEDTGYLKNLANEDTEENRKTLNYINQFYRKIKDFEDQTNEPFVRDFIELLNFELQAGDKGSLPIDPNEGPESIKILTCHAAKGLEFSYVFVVNMVDQRFPTRQRNEPIELPDALVKEISVEGDIHLEEERRLFYVACTRAKKGLFFTSAESYGGTRKKKVSRFLQELETLKIIQLGSASEEDSTPLSKTKIATVDAKKTSYQFPPYFSFTQLKAFETCPLQYKYAHILKIPVKGRSSFSFGKSIHGTLQKFMEQIKIKNEAPQASLFGEKITQAPNNPTTSLPVSLKELLEIYENEWIDEWYENEAEKKSFKEKGRKLLKDFYDYTLKNPPKSKYLEQRFSLKIGDYTLRGAIDRADESGDGLVIIDYKTGKSKNEQQIKKLKLQEQLYLYQIAAEEVLNEKVKAMTFYYVEDGTEVSFLGTSEDLEKLKKNIIEQIQEIEQSHFPETPDPQICRHCDFKEICEKRML